MSIFEDCFESDSDGIYFSVYTSLHFKSTWNSVPIVPKVLNCVKVLCNGYYPNKQMHECLPNNSKFICEITVGGTPLLGIVLCTCTFVLSYVKYPYWFSSL